MARFARVIAPGYPHHATQRGNRRQQTFFSNAWRREWGGFPERADARGGGGDIIAPRADGAALERRGLRSTPGGGAGPLLGARETGEEAGWGQA